MSRAFLASSWGSPELRDLRARIWDRYSGKKTDQVWVAEGVRPDLDPARGASQLEIADACLDAIEEAREFVLLDTGEYGTRLGYEDAFSEASFLEMELFQAALLSKPITIFFVAQAAERSPLGQLAARLTPHIRAHRLDRLEQAEDALKRHFDGQVPLAPRIDLSRSLMRTLVTARHTDWRNQRLFEEPQFMDGRVCGPVSAKAELDVAAHYLALAQEQTQTNRTLSRTWIAMRTLMPTHYVTTTDPTAIKLWDRALRLWSGASAWRGMHGHLWLGNVSVLGALAALRRRVGTPLFDADGASDGDLYNGFASVYYSISNRAPLRMRARLAARSVGYVECGLATRAPAHRGTLLPLRGSLNFRQFRFRAAARDYGEALDLAIAKNDSSGNVGFLMTELGFAELLMIRPRQARRRIEEGLSLMTANVSSPGFRARALHKHAYAALASCDVSAARRSAQEVGRIAESYQLYDQNSWLVRKLTQKQSH